METLEELIFKLNPIKKENIYEVGYVNYYGQEAELEELLCSLVTESYEAEKLANRLTIHVGELESNKFILNHTRAGSALEGQLCSLITNPFLAEQLAKRMTSHAKKLQNKEIELI